MPLKNRQQAIPGGFDWNEPKTGWTYRSDVFTTTRDAIIAHRMANPQHKLRTDPEHVEWEMEQRYEAKLRNMAGGGQWLILAPADSPPPVFTKPRNRAGVVAAVSDTAKAGIGLLKDAFGPTLKTVPSETSEARSKICAVCPENKPGNHILHAAGSGLKMLLEARDSMKLKTSNDDKMDDCAVCTCNLKVKVHVVLPYILEKTTPEVMQRFPENCWIKHPHLIPE